ncbi:MAG TPA: glutamine synthetase family protein [Acidimicrobiales bacterium]|nr:glutamine synthetase family protein [Acidimicrobiales bacterium]
MPGGPQSPGTGVDRDDLVAACYPDNGGISRVKVVPGHRLDQAAASGIGMSPVFDAFLSDDAVIATADAGGPVGDLRLHPDPAAVRRLPMDGWWWAPADRRQPDGSAHPQCHRAAARRMVDRAAAAGLDVRMGFEVEWVAGRADGGAFPPVSAAPAYGMSRVVETGAYLRAVYLALQAAGLDVEQLHPEYSPGQFEVALPPADPVAAADGAFLAQEVVRAVGRTFGYDTSFSPVVWAGGVGNGRHVHTSVRRAGVRGDRDNLLSGGDGPRGVTRDGEAFMAGLLANLPALVALGCPSPVSFHRLVPGHWSGPFGCWGLENREAALRLVTAPRAGHDPSANVEWKNPDATASPYLVVAGVLACGLHGLATAAELPDEITVDPAQLAPAEVNPVRTAQGDGPRRPGVFPVSLAAALAAFDRSDVLADALGPALHRTYAAVRRAELDRYGDEPVETLVPRYRFRY